MRPREAESPDSDQNDQSAVVEPGPELKPPSFVVVGVGASAGGLEAFMELLKPIPDRPGMAFVLIRHLDPKHESAMTELLARGTGMPVRQVHDGTKVKLDCVYVIPPNRTMTIHRGVLLLAQRDTMQGHRCRLTPSSARWRPTAGKMP